MSTLLLLYSNAVWLFAGFVNGVTSFGGNMVAVPFISLAMDPKDAILFACLTGVSITAALAFLYHSALPRLEFILACLSGAVGIPFGVWMLQVASVRVLLFLSGAIILVFLLWQFLGRKIRREGRIPLWCIVPMGMLSGFFLGCTGMGGPVLAMYAVLRGWTKEETLATMNTQAALVMLFMIFLQWREGLYTAEMLHGAAWGMPCAVIGVLLSIPVIRRLDAQLFRKGLLAMLALSTLMLFWRCFS